LTTFVFTAVVMAAVHPGVDGILLGATFFAPLYAVPDSVLAGMVTPLLIAGPSLPPFSSGWSFGAYSSPASSLWSRNAPPL
jgi:hypothetical protein